MKHPLQTTPIVEWNAGAPVRRLDEIVAEEPLEVRVNGAPVTVTMRTPGDDFDLAIGLLFTEGIIDARDDVDDVKYAREERGQRQCNVVEVTLRAGKSLDEDHLRRHFVASSSCGICGKASIDAVRARNLRPLDSGWRFDAALLPRLPDALRDAQTLFGRTGGLHAAGLFDAAGRLLGVREDVGRHNAVDKIVGHALAEGRVPLSERVLLVSGRGGFEIVQKAVVAGVPVLASVSAPSSLAVQLARETGLTLIGFLRGQRFIVYAGEERLTTSAEGAGESDSTRHAV